jgi:hypothetical protein
MLLQVWWSLGYVHGGLLAELLGAGSELVEDLLEGGLLDGVVGYAHLCFLRFKCRMGTLFSMMLNNRESGTTWSHLSR